jgi:hypothetical protein
MGKMNEQDRPSCDISTHGGNMDLLRELRSHGVVFLIVGGAAVAAYRCRDETHIDEIDILIDPTIENCGRVIAALTASGVGIPFSPSDLAQPNKRVPIHSMQHDADIMTPKPDKDFADLIGRSVSATMIDIDVPVIGISDLIDMKRLAAQESEDSAKHQRDLDRLKERT